VAAAQESHILYPKIPDCLTLQQQKSNPWHMSVTTNIVQIVTKTGCDERQN